MPSFPLPPTSDTPLNANPLDGAVPAAPTPPPIDPLPQDPQTTPPLAPDSGFIDPSLIPPDPDLSTLPSTPLPTEPTPVFTQTAPVENIPPQDITTPVYESPQTTPAPLFTPPMAEPPAFNSMETPLVAPPPELPSQSTPVAPATLPSKSTPLRFLIPAGVGLAFLGLLFFIVTRFVLPLFNSGSQETTGTPKNQITISYQGLWEPAEVMQPVLDEFEKQNPNIKVNYQMQSHVDYRERLQTSLAQKTTPDVVRFHSTWLPMIINNLQAAPTTVLTSTEIQSNFYQAVSDAVVVNNQIYAAPSTFEGLALFVNQSMLDTAQLQPPKTWEDLRAVSKTLTQKDPTTGAITQAGAALGTTSNVDHWPDIVSLMSLQNAANLKTPDEKVGEALSYYATFANPASDFYSWNDTFPTSTQAFAAGKVAMILAPSWRALDVKTLNPSLSWKIYPVPQLPESPTVTWANFWVEGVPKNSAHSQEAWKLVKFLASSQAQQLLFNAATQQRGYAQAPANKALSTALADNPIIGPYLQQSQYAKTFFTTSLTHDGPTGINSRLIKYLEDAVNALNQERQMTQVLPPLQQGFQQVLSQYGLVQAAAPTGTTTVQP